MRHVRNGCAIPDPACAQILLAAVSALGLIIMEKLGALICHAPAGAFVVFFTHVRGGIPTLAAILIPGVHARAQFLIMVAESSTADAFRCWSSRVFRLRVRLGARSTPTHE